MLIEESKRYGGKIALSGIFLLFLLIEITFLIIYTKADFANGILFFLEPQTNIYFILFTLSSFATFYLFGRWAGNYIITKRLNVYILSLLFATITTMLVLVYLILYLTALYKTNITSAYSNYVDFLRVFLQNFLIAFVPVFVLWLFCCKAIKSKFKEHQINKA